MTARPPTRPQYKKNARIDHFWRVAYNEYIRQQNYWEARSSGEQGATTYALGMSDVRFMPLPPAFNARPYTLFQWVRHAVPTAAHCPPRTARRALPATHCPPCTARRARRHVRDAPAAATCGPTAPATRGSVAPAAHAAYATHAASCAARAVWGLDLPRQGAVEAAGPQRLTRGAA